MSIHPTLKSVFIKVNDMKKAIEWYSKLLNIRYIENNDFGNIYVLPLSNDISILLDSHNSGNVQPSPHELFMLPTDNIRKAYNTLKELDVNIVTGNYGEIYEDQAVSFIKFKDLDGNVLMVCEEKT